MTAPTTGFAYLDGATGDRSGVLAFAHRGGAFHPEIEGLENTMAAFEHAVALGYAYLETDVHVTSDGVLLAFHDTVLALGSVPMPELDRRIDAFIADGGKGPYPEEER